MATRTPRTITSRWGVAIIFATAVFPSHMTGQQDGGPQSSPGSSWPAGVRLEFTYVGDGFLPLRGGLSRDPAYLDNLDLMMELDLNTLLGIRGARLRVHGQSNRGSSISARVGDLQGLSNIEAPTRWRLYETWLELNPVRGRLSILLGVYDLNSEFDVIPGATGLINSSFGFGPEYSLSGTVGPSTFPFTSLGFRIKARPLRDIYAALAVSDGVPGGVDDLGPSRFALSRDEGALVSWEAGFVRPFVPEGRAIETEGATEEIVRRIGRGRRVPRIQTKLGVGGWVYSNRFRRWDTSEQSATSWGLYALVERLVFAHAAGQRRLSLFVRVGTASDEVNRLGAFVGAGAIYRGLIPWRREDVLGLGVAHARNGTPFMAAEANTAVVRERAETAVEVSYAIAVRDLATLQPMVQWIVNPSMDPNVENALVIGVRGALTLEVP